MLIAYIDPGLGTLIVQTVVATFVGAFFYINKTRKWIVATVRRAFGREEKPDDVAAEETGNEADAP